MTAFRLANSYQCFTDISEERTTSTFRAVKTSIPLNVKICTGTSPRLVCRNPSR